MPFLIENLEKELTNNWSQFSLVLVVGLKIYQLTIMNIQLTLRRTLWAVNHLSELDSLPSDNNSSVEEEEANLENRLATWALEENIIVY